MLTVEQFGSISFVISVGSIIAILSEYRVTDLLINELRPKVRLNNLISSITITLVVVNSLLISTLFVSSLFFDEINYHIMYTISIFLYSFKFIKNIILYQGRYQVLIFVELVSIVAFFCIVIFYVLLGGYAESDFYSIRIFDSLITFSFFVIMSIYMKINFKLRRFLYAKRLLKKYFVLIVAGFSVVLFQKMDQIAIKSIMGEYELGKYSAYINVVTIMSVIVIIIAQADMYSLKRKYFIDQSDYVEYVKDNLKISMGISAIYIICSDYIVGFLFGNRYCLNDFIFCVFSGLIPMTISLGATGSNVIIAKYRHSRIYLKTLYSMLLGLFRIPLSVYFFCLKGGVA